MLESRFQGPIRGTRRLLSHTLSLSFSLSFIRGSRVPGISTIKNRFLFLPFSFLFFFFVSSDETRAIRIRTGDRSDAFVWKTEGFCRGVSDDGDVTLQELHRVSMKSLYNFKDLLQRHMKRQTSGNYCKMRRVYLSTIYKYIVI